MKVDGGCHCGAIRFRAEVTPGTIWLCHCRDCQTLTGSAYRSTILALTETFAVEGEPRCYIRTTEDGFKKRLFFCGDCGSPIYGASVDSDPVYVSLRVGTIRQRADLGPPALQMWCRSALDWATLPGIPKAQAQPSINAQAGDRQSPPQR